jgi:uncharacterized membrane protein YwaF
MRIIYYLVFFTKMIIYLKTQTLYIFINLKLKMTDSSQHLIFLNLILLKICVLLANQKMD